MNPCDACGDHSQFRLMVCHRCWRRLPKGLLDAWTAARTVYEKCEIAIGVREWARREAQQLSG